MWLSCCWGFVLLLHSLLVPSLLWLSSCLGWLRYLSKIPWTLRTFQPSPRVHTCLDWASYYKIGGCRRSPWDHPNDRPPFDFLPTCCQHRLGHFFQFNVWTFCSWASNMLCLHFLGRMTSLCSRRGLGWWWTKSSPNPLRLFWSGCSQKTSMKLSNWCWAVESTKTSTRGKG